MTMKSTTQPSGLWNITFGELGATLKALQDHGVTREHLARLRAEPDYARRVAKFMLRGGLDASIHQKLAREIMGKNIWLPEDWVSFYGWRPSQEQLLEAAEFPWGEDTLNFTCPLCGKVVKDCHFTFLGLDRINGEPLTILKWQELYPATGQPKFALYAPSAWYSKQKFAKETTMDFRWYLLHQSIVPRSEGKTHNEQKAMLPPEYEMPSAIVEATKDILVFRKMGVRLNPSTWAACTDRAADTKTKINAGYVSCGYFDEDGLDLRCEPDNRHNYSVGLAASRKLPEARRPVSSTRQTEP